MKKTIFPSLETDDPDGRLVRAALLNPAAFGDLYDRWLPAVYRYFYNRTRSQAAAEDLTSQLFLNVYQALPRYRHSGFFAAWLFRIAANIYKMDCRRSRRELPLNEALPLFSTSDPPTEILNQDESRRLQNLVAALSNDEQELLRLRYVAGLSFAEIAQILNKRDETVKKSLYRLQARLSDLLEKQDE
ncbi:MAG: sigma-70 family RNA polymerase sigma factor [Anaerolineae bacterium]|nr:sigma-70 family RNA polymerase sigma factor [Anaerolineae bacterium]